MVGAAFAGILSNVPAGFFRGLCNAADLGDLWNVRKRDPEWIYSVPCVFDSDSLTPVWRKKTKKTRNAQMNQSFLTHKSYQSFRY